jgi:NinB protein
VYFVLKNDDVKNNCIEKIKSLDGVWDVFIDEHGSLRSKAQNRLYWKFMKIIGDYCGYDKDDMHFVFAIQHLDHEKCNVMGFERIKVKSTTTLTVKQFCDYMTHIEKFAVENNIKLPYPDNFHEIF